MMPDTCGLTSEDSNAVVRPGNSRRSGTASLRSSMKPASAAAGALSLAPGLLASAEQAHSNNALASTAPGSAVIRNDA